MLCSRLYIDPLSSPTNFNQINDFLSVDGFSEDVANLFKNSIRNFKLKVCFLNIEHFYAINSDAKRCLMVKVISKPYHLVIMFFEIFTRILYNFFL